MFTIALNKTKDFVKEELKRELIMTGIKQDSYLYSQIDAYVSFLDDEIIAHSGQADYAIYIERGLKANPSYKYPTGSGKKSMMLLGLIKHAERGGFSGKRARSIAFAMMYKRKKYGVDARPFVQNFIDKNTDKLADMIGKEITNIINENL